MMRAMSCDELRKPALAGIARRILETNINVAEIEGKVMNFVEIGVKY